MQEGVSSESTLNSTRVEENSLSQTRWFTRESAAVFHQEFVIGDAMIIHRWFSL